MNGGHQQCENAALNCTYPASSLAPFLPNRAVGWYLGFFYQPQNYGSRVPAIRPIDELPKLMLETVRSTRVSQGSVEPGVLLEGHPSCTSRDGERLQKAWMIGFHD